MHYEVFLSYSSKDAALARRFYLSLNALNFPVFLDQEKLVPGYSWNNQLRKEIKEANHLVVLWSSNAKESQWVTREISEFENRPNHGLIIFVCLDLPNTAYNNYQSLNYLRGIDFSEAAVDSIDLEKWNKTVNKIRESIYITNGSTPIKRVVFTLTTGKLAALNFDRKPEIEPYYGPAYCDWKPFGSDSGIVAVLDEFLYVDINQKARSNGIMFHWEDLDWQQEESKLWLDISDDHNIDIIEKEINDLEGKPAILVLDPFSVNDPLIKERFDWCYNKCFANEQAIIMSLNSYPIPDQFSYLRRQLRRNAKEFYDAYFNPSMVNVMQANYFMNIIDSVEAKRQILVTLRNQINNKISGTAFTKPRFI